MAKNERHERHVLAESMDRRTAPSSCKLVMFLPSLLYLESQSRATSTVPTRNVLQCTNVSAVSARPPPALCNRVLGVAKLFGKRWRGINLLSKNFATWGEI